MRHLKKPLALIAAVLAMFLLAYFGPTAAYATPKDVTRRDATPNGGSPASASVELCDGETQLALDALPTDAAGGMAVAAALMAEWNEKHPGEPWVMGSLQDPVEREKLLRERYQPKAPFDNRVQLGEGQSAGHPYRDFTERDITLWERETMRLVFEGAEVFHDGNRLGSTIAVSCDMCHPDASNTHPETYPKYQTQIGKPVMLREMINWCLEHPVRAKPMAHDDPRLLAMEAYIYAQRKGTPLDFGKH